jgi:diguanylate cyclase (GGDEF)-like protein/PAS domain S-box-containing protein
VPDSPKPVPQSIELSDLDSPFFYKTLLDNLYDGVYFVDCDRKITYWNKGAERLTGYTAAEAIGRHCFDNFLVHVNEEGCTLCLGKCPLASTIADGESREAEVYFRHKQGHRVPVSVRVTPIVDSAGGTLGAVEVFSDVTEKKHFERRAGEMESLAFRDALTGVPNRRYVGLKVKQALQEVEQFGRSFGVLMIDVDHFKQVNDTYGHDIGDSALRAVCATITHTLRQPGDIVGRWGGEEFLAVVVEADPTALMAVAERCRRLVAESAVPVGEKHLRVTVSLGATIMKQGDSDQSVIKRADELMYKSKTSGRNRTTLG